MSLPWVRLDSGIGQNPKIIALAVEGRWRAITAYLVALGWCGQQNTGGFIPASALPFVHATRKDATHLEEVGLWHRSDIGDGYIVNDWADYQPATNYQANTAQKSRKGNCIRWHGHACGCWKTSQLGSPGESPGDRPATPTDGRTDGLTRVVGLVEGNHVGNAHEKTPRR